MILISIFTLIAIIIIINAYFGIFISKIIHGRELPMPICMYFLVSFISWPITFPLVLFSFILVAYMAIRNQLTISEQIKELADEYRYNR